jgi:hypothetical protein
MKTIKLLLLFCLAAWLTGCAWLGAPAASPPAPASPAAVMPASPAPVERLPTGQPTPMPVQATPAWQTYQNPAFGLSFQFPAAWDGPDAYISDRVLRLEIGSDTVYPYGTGLEERFYTIKDSYYIVIQYSQNDQNAYWRETLEKLLAMQDGEVRTGPRELLVRVRQLELGRFSGVEYIATLPDTAQTELSYSREVLLFDEQSNLLSMRGLPNNVQLADPTAWREAYRQVDEANLAIFYQILESIALQEQE